MLNYQGLLPYTPYKGLSPWLGGVPLSVMCSEFNLFSLTLGLISSTLLGPVLFFPEKGLFRVGAWAYSPYSSWY